MTLNTSALEVLKSTSRTFYIPIVRLPGKLRSAVGSAYLCFCAIDEIEDHPHLPANEKIRLLNGIAELFSDPGKDLKGGVINLFAPSRKTLPKVALNICSYAHMAPESVQLLIMKGTSVMAGRMAGWVARNWCIRTEADLDEYTYDVAGCVGLLLTDLWAWHDGTEAPREDAVAFGRSLQAVNIIRNRDEDRRRGVDFFPDGWDFARMCAYIRRQFARADAYMEHLSAGPARDFCQIPLTLAKATLEALESGREKLSREEVVALTENL
ncbi:MAG: squalene/phytoene synthase family protein [Kiritimatiellia bacterium]